MSQIDTTITDTSYGAVTHANGVQGWASIVHRGEDGDPDLLVSFTGSDDPIRIPPRERWNSPTGLVPPNIFVRLSAPGSVRVLIQRTPSVSA